MSRVMSAFVLGLITIIGASCQRSTGPRDGCVEVRGRFDPAAPGFIVSYHNGVDPVATTARLATKYAFTAKHVYAVLPGFAAELSDRAVVGIRCEPEVAAIEHDAPVRIATP